MPGYINSFLVSELVVNYCGVEHEEYCLLSVKHYLSSLKNISFS